MAVQAAPVDPVCSGLRDEQVRRAPARSSSPVAAAVAQAEAERLPAILGRCPVVASGLSPRATSLGSGYMCRMVERSAPAVTTAVVSVVIPCLNEEANIE